MISFLVTGERRPKMPKEKWDLSEFAVEHHASETSAIEVKFGGTAASLFEHLRPLLLARYPFITRRRPSG